MSIAPLATSPQWLPNKSVLSVLGAALGPLPGGTQTKAERSVQQEAANERHPSFAALLNAVGLREAAWLLPISSLSSGERELAALAYALSPGMMSPPPQGELPLTLVVVDELTSAMDYCAAHATAVGLAAYMREHPQLRLLAAGVRDDLRVSLRPSWAYDVKSGRMELFAVAADAAELPVPAPPSPPPAVGDAAAVKALFAPPTVRVVVRSLPPGIKKIDRKLETSGAGALWELFAPLHYLDSDIGTNPTAYIARLDDDDGGINGEPIGFVAVAPAPGRLLADDSRLRYRESRMVIDQNYQGLGIGPRMSPAVAMHVCQHGNGGVLVDSTAAAASSPVAEWRYMVQTSLEALAASRDRDHHNWKRNTPYTTRAKVRPEPKAATLRLTALPPTRAALWPGFPHHRCARGSPGAHDIPSRVRRPGEPRQASRKAAIGHELLWQSRRRQRLRCGACCQGSWLWRLRRCQHTAGAVVQVAACAAAAHAAAARHHAGARGGARHCGRCGWRCAARAGARPGRCSRRRRRAAQSGAPHSLSARSGSRRCV